MLPCRTSIQCHAVRENPIGNGQMPQLAAVTASTTPPSPLMLCEQLIRLAEEADRAGFAVTAEHLVHLAYGVLDDRQPRPHA